MESIADARLTARQSGEKKITIVGAGPAGLACAIALARHGRRVIVREQHDVVGHRFHGDFQGLENWTATEDVLEELQAAGIAPTFDHLAVFCGTAFDPRGTAYPVRSTRPLYYLVRRGNEPGTLDRVLYEQAIKAGAVVRFSDRAETIDGPAVLAGGPRAVDAIAVGYVFDTDMPDGDWLALNKRLAPLGYSYLLVHNGRGTVASCMFAGFKSWEEYVARTVSFFEDKAGLIMRNPRRFGGFASFRAPCASNKRGQPIIGEAAGLQDALAGFGIRYAMRSGLLAARSIIEGTDYGHLWRKELLPLVRVAMVNRFVFNILGEFGWGLALRKLGSADTGAVLRRFYQPSLWSSLIFPLAARLYHVPLGR